MQTPRSIHYDSSRARMIRARARLHFTFKFLVLISLSTAMEHAAAAAQTPIGKEVTPSALTIKMRPGKKAKIPKDVKKLFPAFCQQLGEALSIGKSVWGEGIFPAYNCPGKKGGKAAAAGDWRLDVQVLPKTTSFLLYYLDKKTGKKGKSLEASTVIKRNIKDLVDPKIIELIAADLLDILPFSRVVENSEVETFKHVRRDQKRPVITAPEQYAIFTLRRHQGVWSSYLVGQAKLVTPEAKLKKGAKWEITYSHPRELERYGSEKMLWASRSTPRGDNHEKITARMTSLLPAAAGEIEKLSDLLTGTFAAGYVGFRYGFPIARTDPLLKKSRMVGIFTEVRDGPLDGLRWYWDFAPKVKVQANDQTYNMTWSRVTFGWSFGLDFDWIINKIDVVPKIGLTDFDATLGVPSPVTPGEFRSATFRAKNITNFGIEVGIESTLPWFLFRAWGAGDASGYIDIGGDTTVSSLRGGMDAYFQAYEMDKYKLSVLLFVFGERINLQRKNVGEVTEDTVLEVNEVGFNTFFFGPGLTLTW